MSNPTSHQTGNSAEQKADCNGVRLAYDCFGQSQHPAILLIMGLGTQMIYWDPQFCQQLANKGFYVIRFDNRDVGRSSWLKHQPTPSLYALLTHSLLKKRINASYNLSDMARDSVALLDHLDIQTAHVVGISMGGMIGQTIAIEHPERVLSLTSIMSSTGSGKLPKAKLGFALKLFKPISSDPNRRKQQLLNTWRLLHGDHFVFEQVRMTGLVELSIQRGINPAGLKRQLAAIMYSGSRTKKLAQLKLPTLVIHGDQDQLLPPAHGQATADVIPNAQLLLFRGMGHTLPHALWSEIIEAITDTAERKK